MQKEYFLGAGTGNDLWTNMWTTRTIEQELEACDIEVPPRDLFLTHIPKSGRIVDAGCGLAKWVIYLQRRGYDIIGIDNNEMAVAKLKEFDPSLRVEFGDILDIHYPDSYFDAYITMGVIEHFEEGPSLVLQEAHRVLKPGGLIFVSVPTVNGVRKVFRWPVRVVLNSLPRLPLMLTKLVVRRARKGMGGHLAGKANSPGTKSGRFCHFAEYRYSRAELEGILRAAGFEVVETVPHDFYGSRDHAVGLVVDFRFLGKRNGYNFQLNWVGKLVSRALLRISPWVACASVVCVARCRKTEG
jgi:SAM-dependent methyltransferase